MTKAKPFYIALTCMLAAHLRADPIIHSVTIERHPVFTGEDLHPVQSTANKWHITTKEHVISNELLFAEGDPLDESLLEETERNLRSFDYLGSVEVTAETNMSDTVDVKVTTQDQWSLIPSVVIDSAGGLTRVGGAVEEYNFLGLGKNLYLDAIYETDVGTTYSGYYFDPNVAGSDYEADLGFSYGPLIEGVYFSAGLPFKSLSSKWSYGTDASYEERVDRLFNDGEEVSRLGATEYGFGLDGTRAWGKRHTRKTLTLGYEYTSKTYSTLGAETTTPLPEDQVTGTLETLFKFRKQRFIKEDQIDYFDKVEDYTIGRTTGVGIGRAGFPIPVGENWWEYRLDHDHAFELGNRQYLFTDLGFRSQTVQNTILDIDSQYYFRGLDWQTLAFNVEAKRGWDLQSNKQFVLGAESGLRGYPARAFNGDKVLLFNLESRQFWALRFLTIDLGSVLFFDVGNAWKRNESVDLSELKYSGGVGLRLGQSKLPGSSVIRLDLGWPIDDAGEMQVSFGVGQYF